MSAAQSFEPVPNYTPLRLEKAGYDTRYQIDTEHPLYNDQLVDPREAEFGFEDASSYYARPNSMTGETLPGVPDAPLVRLHVAKTLVRANVLLQTDPDVREVLGAPARLKIDDALRPYQVQKFAYEIAWPQVIRSQNPEYVGPNGEALPIPDEVLKKYVAKPADHPTPTPHLTGGAVDVGLVNMETNQKFDRGHAGGAIKGTAYPDFHEGYHLMSGASDIENSEAQVEVAPEGSEVVTYRRVLHWAMSKAGLYVNPTEIWHWGQGDPLSAFVSGDHHPYYGVAELPDWYVDEMRRLQP